MMAKHLNQRVIDMRKVEEEVKAKLSTEEEQVEEVPINEVHKQILEIIDGTKKAGERAVFVFDSFINKTVEEFNSFLSSMIGPPDYVVRCTTSDATIKQRFKTKNEVEEIGEE